MSVHQSSSHQSNLDRRRRLERKEQKLAVMEALAETYARLGWDRPGHRSHKDYEELQARMENTRKQLGFMGADVVPVEARTT